MNQSDFTLTKSRQHFYLRLFLTFTVIFLTAIIFCLFKLFLFILSQT